MKFRAIMQGNFGAISVNNRFRELYERIDALEARIGTETPEIHAAIVEPEDTATTNTADTVTLEDQEDERDFNWRECEDATDLKEFALLEFGLSIKGNKKADTVRAEIKGFLETQGA